MGQSAINNVYFSLSIVQNGQVPSTYVFHVNKILYFSIVNKAFLDFTVLNLEIKAWFWFSLSKHCFTKKPVLYRESRYWENQLLLSSRVSSSSRFLYQLTHYCPDFHLLPQLCMLLPFLDQKMMLQYKELKNRAWKHSSHKRPAYHRSVNIGEKVKIEVEELCISKCSGSSNSHFLF